MANEGQHRHVSPSVWLLPKLLFSPVLSRHCLLHQSHPSPSPRLSSTSILSHSPLPGQIHVEKSCASQTPDRYFLEPPFLFCELMEFSGYFSCSISHNVMTTACILIHCPTETVKNEVLLTYFLNHTRACTQTQWAMDRGRWLLSRLRAPRGHFFVSFAVSSSNDGSSSSRNHF